MYVQTQQPHLSVVSTGYYGIGRQKELRQNLPGPPATAFTTRPILTPAFIGRIRGFGIRIILPWCRTKDQGLLLAQVLPDLRGDLCRDFSVRNQFLLPIDFFFPNLSITYIKDQHFILLYCAYFGR